MYTQVVKEDKLETQNFLFILGLLMVGVMGGILGIFWTKLPPQLPWFYSLPWGEEQLVSKVLFGGIIVLLGVLLILTKWFANWAGYKDRIVKNTVMTGGLIMVIFFMAGFIKVLSIFLK